ncbi:MAG: TatD family hydrolase [Bacteroidales bacterium]
MYIDTHTHLYLDAFAEDRDRMIERARSAGVEALLLPNIDSQSVAGLLELTRSHPGLCHPMAGLHPTSVKENVQEELERARALLDTPGLVGIGETGMDLYWDKTFVEEQARAFAVQIGWAKETGLPLVIHARESFPEIFRVLDACGTDGLKGVFHSFTGGRAELEMVLDRGFHIGINGIVTFRNSDLAGVAAHIPLDRLLLETDAPYLAPVPHRGKRNEPAYLPLIAGKMAEIHNLKAEEIGTITSRNARTLFSLPDL